MVWKVILVISLLLNILCIVSIIGLAQSIRLTDEAIKILADALKVE